MRRRRTVLRTLACALACWSVAMPGAASRYDLGSVLEGAWSVQVSARACRLSRHLPGVGEANFERSAGAAERFRLRLARRLGSSAGVQAAVEAPAWHPRYPSDVHLAPVRTAADGRTLELPATSAVQLRTALADGFLGVFTPDDAPADGWAVPGTAFASAHARYARCVAALPPPRVDNAPRARAPGRAVRPGPATPLRVKLAFAEQESALSASARRRLDALLATGTIGDRGLAIAGFSDDTGDYGHNVALSRRRAEAVAAYLRARGVPPARLSVRYFGDQYPLADSLDPDGRAANRRVVVRVQ